MHVIPFESRHVPETAQLFCRVFRAASRPNLDAVARHLHDVYLANPWVEQNDPSLVLEVAGRVAGFLGVIPFPFRLGNRAVRAAIGGNFMMDPEAHVPLGGARLMRRFLEASRDLSMTDTSNEAGRAVWESYGGRTLHLESLQWLRVLRPAEFALSVAARKKAVRLVAPLGRPLARLTDAALAMPSGSPFRFVPARRSTAEGSRAQRVIASELEARTLAPDDVIEGMERLSDVQSLVPDYTPESLAWLLNMAGRKREFGQRLDGKALFHRGALVGWYLYYPNPGRWGQVLQVLARASFVRPVLEHLFAEAWSARSTALIGRVHPLLMNELPTLRCLFLNRQTWVQVHSRDEEILAAVKQGEGLLTRLEGEWWTRFQNDSFDEADAVPWRPSAVSEPAEVENAVPA